MTVLRAAVSLAVEYHNPYWPPVLRRHFKQARYHPSFHTTAPRDEGSDSSQFSLKTERNVLDRCRRSLSEHRHQGQAYGVPAETAGLTLVAPQSGQ